MVLRMKNSVPWWCSIVLLMAGMLIPAPTPAQPGETPPIAIIDFYGLRTISEQRVQALLPFEVGDIPQPEQAESLERDLAAALNVHDVEIEGACCVKSGVIIYIGVQERPGSSPRYHESPKGAFILPAEIVNSAEQFEVAVMEAVNSGMARDDWSEGHSLLEYPPARSIQKKFIGHADEQGELLHQVLHESANSQHRAIAAMVLAYSIDKASVVEDLTRAASDSDPDVRNNVMRALAIIALYANGHPESGITIQPDPFIGMLNSVVFDDRSKAALLLMALTEDRSPELMERLRQQALPSLIEMCRWKNWGHANPACLILQRIVGLPDDQDPAARGPTIEKALELLPPQDLTQSIPQN